MDEVAVVDQDECVECGACRRSRVCATEAFYQPPLAWPRVLRAVFSDQSYRLPGAPPRSSEGMKIGDVTGNFKRGYASFMVELGRPGVGAHFRDLEKVTTTMAAQGFPVSGGRSLAQVIADPTTGRVKDEVRNEKASRISVSYTVPLGQVPVVWEAVQRAAREVDTVISVGLVRRCEEDGSVPDLGLPTYPDGKTNVGLGRPRAQEV